MTDDTERLVCGIGGVMDEGGGQVVAPARRWIATTIEARESDAPRAWVLMQVTVHRVRDVVRAVSTPLLVTDGWALAERCARRASVEGDDLFLSIVERPLVGFEPGFVVEDREVVVVHHMAELAEGRAELCAVCIVPSFEEAAARFTGKKGHYAAACPMRVGIVH